MKNWSILLIILCLAACQGEENSNSNKKSGSSIEGIEFVEEVIGENGKTIIPYQKFVLGNGLTLILHSDNSDPFSSRRHHLSCGVRKRRFGQVWICSLFRTYDVPGLRKRR